MNIEKVLIISSKPNNECLLTQNLIDHYNTKYDTSLDALGGPASRVIWGFPLCRLLRHISSSHKDDAPDESTNNFQHFLLLLLDLNEQDNSSGFELQQVQYHSDEWSIVQYPTQHLLPHLNKAHPDCKINYDHGTLATDISNKMTQCLSSYFTQLNTSEPRICYTLQVTLSKNECIDNCIRFLSDILLMITSPRFLSHAHLHDQGGFSIKAQFLLERRLSELPKLPAKCEQFDGEQMNNMRMGKGYYPTCTKLEKARAQSRKNALHYQATAEHWDQPENIGKALMTILYSQQPVDIQPPFNYEYGFNMHFQPGSFINMNCTLLDGGMIFFGQGALCAPGVDIYTINHPINPDLRQSLIEYTAPVELGDNVWIGGRSVILPGVRIGDNAVVAAGSVVTRDVPANTLVAGNPAKIIRKIV